MCVCVKNSMEMIGEMRDDERECVCKRESEYGVTAVNLPTRTALTSQSDSNVATSGRPRLLCYKSGGRRSTGPDDDGLS